MARSKQQADFRRCIELLRDHCPTLHPVVVRRSALAASDKDKVGHATLRELPRGKTHFSITIDKRISYSFQVWVLIHEWAHCMVWDHRYEDHDAHFGIAYSKAYNAIFTP